MGRAQPPPVVFVHGTRLGAAQWNRQLADFRASTHAWAVDLPGHGTRRDERFTMDAAIARVVESVGSDTAGAPIVVGHSLGGYVAMALAARHPRLVRALLLVNCTASTRGLHTAAHRLLAAALPRLRADRVAGIGDRALRRYPPEVTAPLLASGYAHEAIPASWRGVLDLDALATLAGVEVPVLYLNGQRDRLFRLHERSFLTAVRGSRLELIAGAGHLCNLDAPAAFSQAVDRFMREVACR